MPVYDVYESESNERIGSFNGEIEENSFTGTWKGEPLSKRVYNSWIIKKNDIVVMENCMLEGVDSFDRENQLIFGKRSDKGNSG